MRHELQLKLSHLLKVAQEPVPPQTKEDCTIVQTQQISSCLISFSSISVFLRYICYSSSLSVFLLIILPWALGETASVSQSEHSGPAFAFFDRTKQLQS